MQPADTEAPRRVFAYRRSTDHAAVEPARHSVVVVGAGPVGLTVAIDLAQSGQAVVLLDDDDRLAHGSRAISFTKRTLEIWDRLGCAEPMVERGVTWSRGHVFLGEEEVFTFDLLPEGGHKRPAFINIQQYHVESILLDRVATLPNLDLRWRNRAVSITPGPDGVLLGIETPDGRYALRADWVVAADGARSPLRRLMGLHAGGETFADRFLIADIRMADAGFPAERMFWFNPPFHPTGSVLLHRQPDDIWRVDFHLGPDADAEAERQPERVIPRVRALLGEGRRFELEWVSVYTFACRRLEKFRHGRVIFAGDSAHGVSPFGARGANGGVQDADNLAWKLRMVAQRLAPKSLLDSYDDERGPAADENIRQSTMSTDFIAPHDAASRAMRDATLSLARDCPFARGMVNSGRFSRPFTYLESPLNTPDVGTFKAGLIHGAPAVDAPVLVDGVSGWFLDRLHGGGFTVVLFAGAGPVAPELVAVLGALPQGSFPAQPLVVLDAAPAGPPPPGSVPTVEDAAGLLTARYDAQPGTVYLFRPDGHVAARWRRFDLGALQRALARASGLA